MAAMLAIALNGVGCGIAAHAGEGEAPLNLPGICAVAFSPDSTLLAAVSGEPKDAGSLVVRELATRKVRFVHREDVGIPSVAFSPDGKTLAIGIFAPEAKLFSVETGALVRVFKGHENHVRSVAFSRQGDRLVTASYDRTVRLWDIASGETSQTFSGHTDTLVSAALSPDDQTLVSCGNDETTRVWDPRTGEQIRLLSPSTFAVRCVTFSPDGKFFATCHGDGAVRIRETSTAQLRARIGAFAGAECARFSPDGRRLIVASYSPKVQLFDIDLRDPLPELRQKIAELIARWDDDDFAVRESASADLASIGMIAEPQLRAVLKSDSAEVRIRARRVHAAVSSPRPRAELTGHTQDVQCVAFSPDGKLIASGDKGGMVKVWDAASLAEMATFVEGSEEP
jgi:WD40 repeat protein